MIVSRYVGREGVRYETKQCDVLIVGGGGAGALAAIEASRDEHLKVMLVSRGPIGMSGLTPTANGGTAAGGSEEGRFNVMITTGRFLNDQDLAWFMTHEIEHALEKLRMMGLSVEPLGPSAVAVQSSAMLRKLRRHIISKQNIELREDVFVTRLFASPEGVAGVTALDFVTGDLFAIEARAIVLATGGSTGELYPHSSNNPFGVSTNASGTGHAMAFRAGADLVDMEMIQFVPLPAHARCLHIRYFPEFWKGPYRDRFGDVVVDDAGRYGAAASYSPELVQKVYFEMEKGRGPIHIDHRANPTSGAEVKALQRRQRLIKSLGIDPRENKIELTLGSHFSMGGIKVNAETETTLPGLFATGENMGAVHGACRIAGHSFTQMIVFGLEAGKRAAECARHAAARPGSLPAEQVEFEEQQVRRLMEPKEEPITITSLKDRLKQVMERDVFVVRNKEGLTAALRQIDSIEQDTARVQVAPFVRFNLEWMRAVEFPLLLETARIATTSALAREESRGFHYRSDFPNEDNARWLRHTLVRLDGGKPAMGSSPVPFSHITPEAQHG